jgi:hypothetical protein
MLIELLMLLLVKECGDLVMNLPDGSGDLNQAGIEIDQQGKAGEKTEMMTRSGGCLI